jgi:hypothetical protein
MASNIYAIIANDQNPEYKDLFPRIKKRWNQIGIKTVYIDCHKTTNSSGFSRTEDRKGNITYTLHVSENLIPRVLFRWDWVMLARYFIAAQIGFEDDILIISDGDLYPINKQYIYRPSITLPDSWMKTVLSKSLVSTCMYPEGYPLATFTYGYGKIFQKLANLKVNSYISYLDNCAEQCWKHSNMYASDEHIEWWLSQENKVNWRILTNRKWIEAVQEMNNLYDYMIPKLRSWRDLSPFIEFHNMRASTMTNKLWNKLEKLLKEFDEMEITPNNYFYEMIDKPWRDTRITRQGELILGDEYDE